MSNFDIFHNPARTVPSSDVPEKPIDRFSLNKLEIGGRESHLPDQQHSPALTLNHLENK